MEYLCDTNIISEMMKHTPQLEVEQWFNVQPIIRLSVITVEEICFGLA
jgi:predicted nucleic acid-binding protein